MSTHVVVGSAVSFWRYPVKSMMGEELNGGEISKAGFIGDRAYALIDNSDGKVVSAKNPRKWPQLFAFRAALVEDPKARMKLPAVRITLPDGTDLTSDQPEVNRILSKVLGRDVTLHAVGSTKVDMKKNAAEEYWPDMDGLDYRDTVTEFGLPEEAFFDCAVVHVLTTATLARLSELYPQGRFEVRRFRPNVVVETGNNEKDFVENSWLGKTLVIGDSVRLSVTGLCPRCVMTTLPQGDLPNDPGILRTIARHNRANVGIYASVLHGGTVRRGDSVRVE